ncbi:splicing factor, proline- and glutamine-rich-like [Falco cherrug]|uniref:splicing factor, proline- and glutamine-rich-like n=1 Tax=Falco cherrug TaxID=345164 RepID=UPI002478472F|nr:splicing factor, proline- and glutamine-rich-like [Falco cherrug]
MLMLALCLTLLEVFEALQQGEQKRARHAEGPGFLNKQGNAAGAVEKDARRWKLGPRPSKRLNHSKAARKNQPFGNGPLRGAGNRAAAERDLRSLVLPPQLLAGRPSHPGPSNRCHPPPATRACLPALAPRASRWPPPPGRAGQGRARGRPLAGAPAAGPPPAPSPAARRLPAYKSGGGGGGPGAAGALLGADTPHHPPHSFPSRMCRVTGMTAVRAPRGRRAVLLAGGRPPAAGRWGSLGSGKRAVGKQQHRQAPLPGAPHG